jgi:hypothetical protein
MIFRWPIAVDRRPPACGSRRVLPRGKQATLALFLIGAIQATAAVCGGTTSLSDPSIRYTVPAGHWVVMQRGEIEAIVADNHAVDDERLPRHRGGYSGLASIKHARRTANLFVPQYAGLNFEHIHDGRTLPREVLFEPRNATMQLRRVDRFTTELYQPPTPNWKLESCHRYQLLPDGVIELTFECIPRANTFANGYVGLFWASYIDRPESGDIFFRGVTPGRSSKPGWVRATSPQHGVDATHRHLDDDRTFVRDDSFPLTLVFNESPHRHVDNWYYGISQGMAWVVMFRPSDGIRFAQSPSGGGQGNPAWDFQMFLSPYEVGRVYRMVVRAMYVPFESPEQVERVSRPHREALRRQD